MAVLVISNSPDTQWRMRAAAGALGLACETRHGLHDAAHALRSRHWAVVVTEAVLPDGSWRDVLDVMPGELLPPLLVTARLADEQLWSDVLQLGGFDVLAQPFDVSEVQRVLMQALGWPQLLPASSSPSHDPLTAVDDNLPYDSAA